MCGQLGEDRDANLHARTSPEWCSRAAPPPYMPEESGRGAAEIGESSFYGVHSELAVKIQLTLHTPSTVLLTALRTRIRQRPLHLAYVTRRHATGRGLDTDGG